LFRGQAQLDLVTRECWFAWFALWYVLTWSCCRIVISEAALIFSYSCWVLSPLIPPHF
jgi:hypothetical protein